MIEPYGEITGRSAEMGQAGRRRTNLMAFFAASAESGHLEQ